MTSHIISGGRPFSDRIGRSTENGQLCAVLQNTQNQIWLCRRETYDLSGSTAPDYHQSIVKALEDNDRVRAEDKMREHIESVRRRLLQFMEDQEGRQKVG